MKINKKLISILPVVIVFALLYIKGALGPRIAFSLVTTNTEINWNVSFRFLQGRLKGFLTPKRNNPKAILTSRFEKGQVSFAIYNPDNILIGSSVGERTDTIGNLKKDQTYRIEATARRAKGSFDIVIK